MKHTVAKQVVLIYRSFTLGDIKQAWNVDGAQTATTLTGFGDNSRCLFCLDTPYRNEWQRICAACFYGQLADRCGQAYCNRNSCCARYPHDLTYKAIRDARTPSELLRAFAARADHIDKLIKMKD